MKSSRHLQQGMTLVISLIMISMLTLFVISGMNLANINLRITGNYQWQKEAEATAQSAIETLLSSSANFALGGAAQDICRDGSVVAIGSCTLLNPKIGVVEAPVCGGARPAGKSSKALGEIPLEQTDWLVRAAINDSGTGASAAIVQGMSMTLTEGNCPG